MCHQENINNSGNAANTNVQPEMKEQPSNEDESVLKRQNSIFSLTFDEIQSRSGKTFGWMNIDEFLANVWSAEEDQSESQQNEANNGNGMAEQLPQPQPQPPHFTIPIMYCNKTVDEVWSEINNGNHQQQTSMNIDPPQREETLGEMTLEDFLVKAGVVQEAPKSRLERCGNLVPPSADIEVGGGISLGIPVQPNPGTNMPISNVSTHQMGPSNNKVVGETSNANADGSRNRRRIIDGPPEVVVERRQRRMIKNRESAARSRARKQAYTIELELEVNQLKDENEKLKGIVAETTFDEQLRQHGITREEPTRVKGLKKIRRTISLSW